jgi:5-methylcytosine-specific restriction enzyme B
MESTLARLSMDHQIGHAYFMGCTTRAELEDVMREKVIPLLVEYFYDDWSKIWLALGEPPNSDEGAFLQRKKLSMPDANNEDYEVEIERPQYRYTVQEQFGYDAFLQLAR